MVYEIIYRVSTIPNWWCRISQPSTVVWGTKFAMYGSLDLFSAAAYLCGFSARHGVRAPVGTCLDLFFPGDSTALGSLVTWEEDTRGKSKCPGKFERDQGAAKDPWVPITLWWFNIAIENGPFIVDLPIKKWCFSIAMLVYQRVSFFGCLVCSVFLFGKFSWEMILVAQNG